MGSKTIKSEYNKVQNHLLLCRLCLSEELLEDIFNYDDLNLWILDYLSIAVNEDEKISRSICVLCRARLTEFHEFQLRCLEVQNILQGASSTPFEEDFPCSEAKKAKPSSEAHPELTTDANYLQDSLEAGKVKIEYDVDHLETKDKLVQNNKCSSGDESIYLSDMPDHQKKHKGIRPFKCNRGCENVDFLSQKIRDEHYRNIHNAQKQECPICHNWYSSKATLDNHKLRIHSQKKFGCSEKEEYSTKRSGFGCSLCDIEPLTSRTRLKQHMKDHNKYLCPICSSSFKFKVDWNQHMSKKECILMDG